MLVLFAVRESEKKQLRRSAGKRRIITNSAAISGRGQLPAIRGGIVSSRSLWIEFLPGSVFRALRLLFPFRCHGNAQAPQAWPAAALSAPCAQRRPGAARRFGLLLWPAASSAALLFFVCCFPPVSPCPAPPARPLLLLQLLPSRTPLRPGPLASKPCRSKSTRSCLTSGSSR